MRVSIYDLHKQAEELNRMTGNKKETYTRDKNGDFKANIGTFYISQEYGGVSLYRITTKGGGVSDLFGYHMPKKDLYNRINGFFTLNYEINPHN
jgi:hypothetical protein